MRSGGARAHIRLLLAVIAFATPGVGRARAQAGQCKAVVLQGVTDDMGRAWRRGQVLPVDIARDAASGRSFCAHGGSCISQTLRGAPASRLVNCRVGEALGGGDYRLMAVPQGTTRAAAMDQRRQQVTERLAGMGLSNAGASAYADDYVDRPTSPNGRLVAAALAGRHAALARMSAQRP